MPVSESDPAAGCGECWSTDAAPAAHRLKVVPSGQPVPADQGQPTTSPQGADDMPVLMLRYRAGITGETRRTVHAVPLLHARRSADGMLTALCGAILSPAELEIVAFREGMPCIACVFRLVTDTATQVVDR